MSTQKKKQKKRGRTGLILMLVILVLLLAIAAVLALYLRAPADTAPVLPSPASVEEAEPAPDVAVPTVTPYVPVGLKLDVRTSVETLDVVVCDEEGNAVPGYAFELEISREGGGSHTVATDVNGHYYAEYLVGGDYTLTLLAPKGFLAPESVSCHVTEKLDYVAITDLSALVEISEVSELPEDEVQSASGAAGGEAVEELSTALLEQSDGKQYDYSWKTGPNGFLLLANGRESDVTVVERNGLLICGERSVKRYFANDGTPLKPEELPADAILWTDYYTEDGSERVELILSPGRPDPQYAITASERDSSARLVGWQEINGKTYYCNASGYPVTGLKNIDGRLYFFDDTGAKASSLGLDVSYFNSAIDWNAVKAAGVDFVIVRVAGRTWSKGLLFEDEDSYRQGKDGGFYLQGAKAAGLQVGAYVYSNAINTNEAVEEASLALEVLKKSGVELDMPIYIDLEHSGEYPRGRADRLSLQARAEIVRAFCETVENSGYRGGVYASEYFFSRSLRVEDVQDYDLWYAVYTREYGMPNFRDFDIWQFSETVRINGMPDFTDMNVIF